MRIHFTVGDLARTRLGRRPSPLVSATFSAHRLVWPRRRPDPAVDLWRRTVRAAWRDAEPPLFWELAATRAGDQPIPGFLRPHPGLHSLDEELARLRATPRAALRADLSYVARHRELPGWARDLADGDAGAADGLVASVRAYHRVALAPYWRGMAGAFEADTAARTRQLRDGGVERVLGGLGPAFRWRPPVLEIGDADGPDYHLRGRGLLLAPAAFSSYVPCDPDDEQPTLHYEVPVRPQRTTGPRVPPGGVPPGGVLAALLGHSRAAVLEAVAAHDGLSTGELARRAGLSSPSASEHATVLRCGGLIATDRIGRITRHTVTALGTELLLRAADATAAAPVQDHAS